MNNNDTQSTPLTRRPSTTKVSDSFGDLTTDSVTPTRSATTISKARGSPYFSPETVSSGSMTTIPGLNASKAPSNTGDTSYNPTYTVTVGVFDFVLQQGDGAGGHAQPERERGDHLWDSGTRHVTMELCGRRHYWEVVRGAAAPARASA